MQNKSPFWDNSKFKAKTNGFWLRPHAGEESSGRKLGRREAGRVPKAVYYRFS